MTLKVRPCRGRTAGQPRGGQGMSVPSVTTNACPVLLTTAVRAPKLGRTGSELAHALHRPGTARESIIGVDGHGVNPLRSATLLRS